MPTSLDDSGADSESDVGRSPPERLVRISVRMVLTILGVLLGVGIVLYVVWIARSVITWVLISLFLAMAINPLVEWFQAHGIRRRGLAAAAGYGIALVLVAAVGAFFIPTLVSQVGDFVNKVPDYLEELTHGRGPLGFLETKYHIVEKVKDAIEGGGTSRFASGAETVFSVTQGIITAVVAVVTIAFLTFFMLLEGPAWMERFYGLLDEEKQPRWRAVANDIYRTVSGYVRGNLLISLIAGISAGIVLFALGVPYAVALGLVVALFDLIPLAGATLAAIIVTVIAFIAVGLTAGIVVGVFFIVYQQVENHLLQPLIYGRTVELSPLAVLVAILIGAEVAGILGALAAIPVAGSIQVILRDWQRHRRARREEERRRQARAEAASHGHTVQTPR